MFSILRRTLILTQLPLLCFGQTISPSMSSRATACRTTISTASIVASGQTRTVSSSQSNSGASRSTRASASTSMSANTPSTSNSATATSSALLESACPSCPFFPLTTTSYIYLNTTPYNTSTHIEVHMWGGQGGGNYGPGGTGAFVTGLLPISGLGNVLRVLVGSCGAPDAGGDKGVPFQYSGGGRSAIQIPDVANLTGTGWLDMVTAGGGGGSACGTYAVPASSGNVAAPPGGAGPCIPTSFSCTRGAWLQGQAVTSTTTDCLSGGGGGWCGGLSSSARYGATGGGTSRTDQLLCFWGMDAAASTAVFTRDRYYAAGVNSWGGSWGCVPGNKGRVVLVPINTTLFSAYFPRCNAWARAQSCTASVSASASYAKTASPRQLQASAQRERPLLLAPLQLSAHLRERLFP
jgi:hypothetical protein